MSKSEPRECRLTTQRYYNFDAQAGEDQNLATDRRGYPSARQSRAIGLKHELLGRSGAVDARSDGLADHRSGDDPVLRHGR